MEDEKQLSEKERWFLESQRIERQRITKLFENYLRFYNCTNLNLTSIHDYNNVDAFFVSATTLTKLMKTVVMETKVRSHSINLYPDNFIELPKWKALFDFYQAGCTCFFMTEYTDVIGVWDLTPVFKLEESILKTIKIDHQFCDRPMQSNNFDKDEKEKPVRFFWYGKALLLIDKETWLPMTSREMYQKYFPDLQTE